MFVVDIIPPAPEVGAAAGLGLALSGRKGKGFPGRRQYEPLEILARFTIPLTVAAWEGSDQGCRAMIFDPQGLVTGSIRFDLAPDLPQQQPGDEVSEEGFVALCQQLTKEATEFTSQTMEFTGLVDQPLQAEALLKGKINNLPAAGLEQKVVGAEIIAQLRQQLEAYEQAIQAWGDLKQQLYSHRDRLVAAIQHAAQQAREAGGASREELTRQIEAAVAAKAQEVEQNIARVREELGRRRELLTGELDRFRREAGNSDDPYWREQVKATEERLAENDRNLKDRVQELEDSLKEYRKKQEERLKDFANDLEKRLVAIEQRQKRLDEALAGFSKGLEKRLARYEEQPSRVNALTLQIPTQGCQTAHDLVFYAARYPGDRWQVFPPQLLSGRKLKDKVSGLLGGLGLPFKPASKLVQQLAQQLEQRISGTPLEARLVEQNLLIDQEFLAQARAGLTKLIDAGHVDKKQADLFDQF